VLGDVTIGAWSAIGANAVVTKDAPPHSLIVGIPASFKPLSNATADAARGVHDWHI
jgi:serine O-acetyltransferase